MSTQTKLGPLLAIAAGAMAAACTPPDIGSAEQTAIGRIGPDGSTPFPIPLDGGSAPPPPFPGDAGSPWPLAAGSPWPLDAGPPPPLDAGLPWPLDAGLPPVPDAGPPTPHDGGPPTLTCSFTAGPPVTRRYRTAMSATFVDTPVSLDGHWMGTIGGGVWNIECLDEDCQGAADYPEGSSSAIAATGRVAGGEAFEELNWDVCPPDGIVVPGKTWEVGLPASQIDANTVSWEARRFYQIQSVSGGVMQVAIQHITRIAYSFGEPTTPATHPWMVDGAVGATVDVSGQTPIVTGLTLSFLGSHTSGSLTVTAE